jgi:hypothetical protein
VVAVTHTSVASPRHIKASPALAFFVAVALAAAVVPVLGGCGAPPAVAQPPPPEPSLATSSTQAIQASTLPASLTAEEFSLRPLPGADSTLLQALQRNERTAPLRYRVIVIPGSGCAGMGPMADRYFAGLLHAQVLVLHKPGVDAQARTAPGDCARSFVWRDRHSTWLAHARAALRADAVQRKGQPVIPTLLVGISEGAELLPALAHEVPHVAGLVLLSASGLDPQEAGELQARRLGVQSDWTALGRIVQGAPHDSVTVQGRSLGYWRDLWNWPLTLPLLQSPWPILQVWGSDDALVPAVAYERFAQLAALRTAPFCSQRMEGADHGLQRRAEGVDGIQQVWAWTEQWARNPQTGLCAALPP